jgi:hypothetical protein
MHSINISRTTVQHMCNCKGIQILTICLISKGLLFFIHPVESVCTLSGHEGPIQQKSGRPRHLHVDVPDKIKSLIKILLNWKTNMAAVQHVQTL